MRIPGPKSTLAGSDQDPWAMSTTPQTSYLPDHRATQAHLDGRPNQAA
jgi:hypothetical protein